MFEDEGPAVVHPVRSSGSAGEQHSRLRRQPGHCSEDLGPPVRVRVVASPPTSASQHPSASPAIPTGRDQNRGSREATLSAGALLFSWALFPGKEPEAPGMPVGVVLCWSGLGAMRSVGSSLTHLRRFVLSLVQGGGASELSQPQSVFQDSPSGALFRNSCSSERR